MCAFSSQQVACSSSSSSRVQAKNIEYCCPIGTLSSTVCVCVCIGNRVVAVIDSDRIFRCRTFRVNHFATNSGTNHSVIFQFFCFIKRRLGTIANVRWTDYMAKEQTKESVRAQIYLLSQIIGRVRTSRTSPAKCECDASCVCVDCSSLYARTAIPFKMRHLTTLRIAQTKCEWAVCVCGALMQCANHNTKKQNPKTFFFLACDIRDFGLFVNHYPISPLSILSNL